ncbi:MAG: hypothetical protein F2667_14350 [Actinobacteria bacterium]|uniref:Unannotated protein n=1 Tax=freshwater metagenome TaxID=449393 RepID=A0A6J6SFT3_9ZZZZ|nr:hypothetical protein [Actinomycetota bacterium]
MRLSRPVVGAAAVLLLGSGLLSGCGVSEEEVRPGVAATVGDDTISLDLIDEVSGPTCEVLRSSPQLLGDGYTGSSLRNTILVQLVLGSVADQIAEENGIDGEPIYAKLADQIRLQLGGVDDADVEEALPVFVSSNYASSVIDAVLSERLGPDAADSQKQFESQKLLVEWQQEHGIETNPLFTTIDFSADAVVNDRQELSVAVGDDAVAALTEPQPKASIDALPESQRCT